MSKTLAKIEQLKLYAIKIGHSVTVLSNKVANLEADKKQLSEKVAQLEQQLLEEQQRYKVLSMSKSFNSEEDRTKARGKVNEFIREIDKCIALLNK